MVEMLRWFEQSVHPPLILWSWLDISSLSFQVTLLWQYIWTWLSYLPPDKSSKMPPFIFIADGGCLLASLQFWLVLTGQGWSGKVAQDDLLWMISIGQRQQHSLFCQKSYWLGILYYRSNRKPLKA
uniref:Uncharacterized protein n=1 Tax=Pyxicephalus adspersus TaxID=30357 RepID=A0AAV2ZNN2_PYXAD|nr:TPA: hypothetical protein GDO54_004766 [Pyxicephalus adspersus]